AVARCGSLPGGLPRGRCGFRPGPPDPAGLLPAGRAGGGLGDLASASAVTAHRHRYPGGGGPLLSKFHEAPARITDAAGAGRSGPFDVSIWLPLLDLVPWVQVVDTAEARRIMAVNVLLIMALASFFVVVVFALLRHSTRQRVAAERLAAMGTA